MCGQNRKSLPVVSLLVFVFFFSSSQHLINHKHNSANLFAPFFCKTSFIQTKSLLFDQQTSSSLHFSDIIVLRITKIQRVTNVATHKSYLFLSSETFIPFLSVILTFIFLLLLRCFHFIDILSTKQQHTLLLLLLFTNESGRKRDVADPSAQCTGGFCWQLTWASKRNSQSSLDAVDQHNLPWSSWHHWWKDTCHNIRTW